NEFHDVVGVLLDCVRLRDRGGPLWSVGSRVGPVVGADAGGLRDDGPPDVPLRGVTSLAGNDEGRRRSAARAVQEELAAIADVDQPREVGFMRIRRASGDNSEREGKPEQGLHVSDDTTDARQTEVERVLVLGVTSKTFTRDELASAL